MGLAESRVQIALERATHTRLAIFKATHGHRRLTDAVAALLGAAGAPKASPRPSVKTATDGGGNGVA